MALTHGKGIGTVGATGRSPLQEIIFTLTLGVAVPVSSCHPRENGNPSSHVTGHNDDD